MRVLYHHRTLGQGAEGVHIREMIAALRKLGHEVRVVALVGDGSNGSARRSRWWSGVSRFLPRGAYELAEIAYNLVGRRSVQRAIQDFRPDFVYDRYNTYSTAALSAAQVAGVPLLLEVNSPLAYERQAHDRHQLSLPGLAERYERKICCAAEHVFAVSTPLKKFLVEERCVPETNISVLVNGADPDSFDPTINGASVRDQYSLGSRRVIGFVGSLRPWHGFDLLFAAFAQLLVRGINAQLLLVGDGPSAESLREQVAVLGISQRVSFIGAVDHTDLPPYLAAMDVAVTARATFYASPMKILEYMAMGLPVVAPRMPNICDIVEDGKHAQLFEPENAEAMAHALEQVLSSPDYATQLGVAARAKIEGELNWKRNAQQILDQARRLNCGR